MSAKGYSSWIKFIKEKSLGGHTFHKGKVVYAVIHKDLEFNKVWCDLPFLRVHLTFEEMDCWVECTQDGAEYPLNKLGGDESLVVTEKQQLEINDPINHPSHYTSHPSGVECITITRHMNFNLGNVIKYVWRAGLKNDELEDLKKARFYLDDEIKKREGVKSV